MRTATPATSMAAYKALKANPLREEILGFIEAAGVDGAISDDVFAYLATFSGKNDSSVTTRYSELERAGLIYRAGDTRPGKSGRQQMVMRHISFAAVKQLIPPKAKKENPFLNGMKHAAKIIIGADPSFKNSNAAKALRREIEKIARR